MVIIGKTGVGKSTIANQILGKDQFPVLQTSGSVSKRVANDTTTFLMDELHYDITVFDTVGLFDTTRMCNYKIIKDIQANVAKKSPKGINLVLFVFKKGRYTSEEKSCFDLLLSNWKPHVSKVSALVITHCETDNESSRQTIIEGFKTSEDTTEYAKFMEKGIYTVGFPKKEDADEKIYQTMEENMKQDRQNIMKLIVSCVETVEAQ